MNQLLKKVAFKLLFIGFLLFFNSSKGQVTHATMDTENNPNEPTIAIKPNNPNLIAAASNIDNFYYSVDNGKSWTKRKASSVFGVYGDPVLHYAGDTLFFAHLSKTPGKEWGELFDRIVVQKIINPETWEEVSYGIGENGKMQDKPWITSDENGNVYLTWTEFDKYASKNPDHRSRIRFAKYTPESNSFSKPITISDTTGDCLDGDNTLEGATISIGNNGNLYAVWAAFGKIWLDISRDGGLSWNKDQQISIQQDGWDMEVPGILRANGMPFTAFDKQNSELVICFAETITKKSNVKSTYKNNQIVQLRYREDSDSSLHYSKSIVPTNEVGYKYFPNVVIDPVSSIAYTIFYDTRYSPSGMFYDIFMMIDSGGHSSELRLTSSSIPIPDNNFFFGDYIDLDIQNKMLIAIYPTYSLNKTSQIVTSKIVNLDSIYNLAKHFQNSKPHQEPIVNIVQDSNGLTILINTSEPCIIKGRIGSDTSFWAKKYKFKAKMKSPNSITERVVGFAPLASYQLLRYTIKNTKSKTKKSFLIRYKMEQ